MRIILLICSFLFSFCLLARANSYGDLTVNPDQIFNNTCCGTGPDPFCCEKGNETCCPDPVLGGVCCIQQMTYCCPRNNAYGLTSRCCPRWMVCCTLGQDGCCELEEMKFKKEQTVYGIYEEAAENELWAFTLDVVTGSYTSAQIVGWQTWGELPRDFIYNADDNAFHLLQADFLVPGIHHPINFFTINPTNGQWTVSEIIGAQTDGQLDVAGFEYISSTKSIVFSVTVTNGNQDIMGYNFYSLDMTTNEATLMSTYNNVSGGKLYMGWIDAANPSGDVLYRIGYLNESYSQYFGLGVTDISSNVATFEWYSGILPANVLPYQSLNLYDASGDDMTFISMAQTSSGDLNIMKWTSGDATVLSALSNAYNPIYFGYTVEYLNQDSSTYGAFVVRNGILLDVWALTLTDASSGNTQETVFDYLPVDAYTFVGIGFA